MNFGTIKTLVTSKAARSVLKVQKHSPTILFAGGVVGMVGTVVLASKATLKIEDVLDDHKKYVGLINDQVVPGQMYSDEDERQKDKVVLYARTTHKIVRLYGPAIILGTLSIAALTGSHHIMTQRQAGMVAAYTALEKGFERYRRNVVAEFGEDKDRELRYGVAEKQVVIETESGPQVIHEKVAAMDGEYSIYARLFDRDTSNAWSPQSEYNLLFLRTQQNYLNDRLKAKGHVFLNEVYDALGLERTREGSVVGWLKEGTDGYIDFGLFDREMQPQHLAFFMGRENGVWVDFNVDGSIWDKI